MHATLHQVTAIEPGTVGRHRLDDVLDVGVDGIESVGRADDRVGGGGDPTADVDGGVIAGAAVGEVLAGGGGEAVVAVAAEEWVVARAAVQRVVAGVAVNRVVAVAAGNRVIPVAAVDGRRELKGEETVAG